METAYKDLAYKDPLLWSRTFLLYFIWDDICNELL